VKLSVVHRTMYEYNDAVTTSHHIAHLVPRDTGNQRCLTHDTSILPAPQSQRERLDYFGNRTLHFAFSEPHNSLQVIARSVVDIGLRPDIDVAASPPWETVRDTVASAGRSDLLDAYEFTFPSPHVEIGPEVHDLAKISFTPGRPFLQAVKDLTTRIHREFAYDSNATDVHTPVDQIMAQRRGVCQDFAHVQIAALRSLQLPARYISGYLLTRPPPGKPRLVGADASHAWISVFVPDLGWIDFDPTNDIITADEHVSVAWGRDFSDVAPVRGVILGGSRHTVAVSVDVAPAS